MNSKFLGSMAIATTLAFSGCATKKYVKNTTAPIQGQVDQVQAKTNDQGKKLDEQGQKIEQQGTQISATDERAKGADQRAGDAMNRADQAGQKADTANQKSDKNATEIGDLRQVIANFDEYKPVKDTAVPFAFNKDTLTPEAKQKLDELVTDKAVLKHYFIAVEGFTDKIGAAEYNAALSRRRADRVVQYLVAQHDIPIYRIHMIGLGEQKPVEDAKSRAANAKNRRVEVTVYSADQNVTAMNAPAGATTR